MIYFIVQYKHAISRTIAPEREHPSYLTEDRFLRMIL
jgi:hypothetical protein